jgi:hypothetical protein
MSQGPRRGWVRAVFTGLGIIVCTGLVGCWSADKDKDSIPQKYGSNTKQVGAGLPNTPRIPGMPGSGGIGVNGQPTNNGLQPAGGFNAGGRTMGGTNFNTNPGAGLGSGAGVVVPGGPGASSSGSNFGAMGQPNLGPASPAGGNFASGPNNYVGGPGQPISPAGLGQRDPNLAPPNPPDLSLGAHDIIPPSPNTYRPQ